ncbi:PAN5 [Sanghuangporus weigelae]
MRFHVLGLGPVGQLLAFHLRRNLSPKHDISLVFKSGPLARQMRGYPLHIEYDGVVNSVSGFKTEAASSAGGLESYEGLQEAERHFRKTIIGSSEGQNGNDASFRKQTPEENHIESLFVTCKANSTLEAIKNIRRRLSPASTVVLLQNGNLATHEQLLENVFFDVNERPNFIFVSNTHGVWLKRAPFHTVHAGIGQLRFGIVPDGRRDFEKSLHSGKSFNGRPRLSLDDIAFSSNDPEIARYRSLRNTVAVLQNLSGLQTKWDSFSDMQVILRQKLVVNCVINPLTSILGCRNGRVFEHDAGKRLAFRICKEASRVFKKEAIGNRDPGVEPDEVYVPPELSLNSLLRECERVARVTDSNTSSMLADLKKGRKATEVEYLNGYLMTLGKRYDEAVPVNASLVDLIKMRAEIPLDIMM